MKKIGFPDPSLMPTDQEKLEAIGFDLDHIPIEYQPDDRFFRPIPEPNHVDDWLAQYDPYIQSFNEWNRKYLNRKRNNVKTTIYLLPIGAFEENTPSLRALLEYCEAFYSPFPIQLMKNLDIIQEDDQCYLDRNNEKVPLIHRKCHHYYEEETRDDHRQFHAGVLLDSLYDVKPKDAICMLAITTEDLYAGKNDNFVVGLAGSGVAVFSFARYDPYCDNKILKQKKRKKYSSKDLRIFLLRGCKVMVNGVKA